MKAIPLFVLLYLSKNVIAQSSNSPYIYDSTLEIGHIKLLEYLNSKLFFYEYSQNMTPQKVTKMVI